MSVMLCVYSIMGEQQALGIVPQFANELFDRIEEDTDDQVCSGVLHLSLHLSLASLVD